MVHLLSCLSFLTLSFFPHPWWALHCTSLHLDLTDLFCLLTSRARVLRLSLSRLFGSHATGVDTDLLPVLSIYLNFPYRVPVLVLTPVFGNLFTCFLTKMCTVHLLVLTPVCRNHALLTLIKPFLSDF